MSRDFLPAFKTGFLLPPKPPKPRDDIEFKCVACVDRIDQHAANVLALDDDWLCAAQQAPRPLQYSLQAELDVKSVEAMQRVIPQLSSASCLKLLKAHHNLNDAVDAALRMSEAT